MGQEINLLRNYPRTKRNIEERGQTKTDADRALARQFGKDFFDGDRKNGYGGFNYNPKFWTPVVPDLIDFYHLTENSSILDVGCAKGFLVYDLLQALPSSNIQGVDISKYAIFAAKSEIRDLISVADVRQLPFDDNTFDLVICINTVHNLDGDELEKGILELQRVSRNNVFLTVDAYNTDEEKDAMFAWNLTAKTIMSVEEWKHYFDHIGYYGDYYWFMP